MAKKSRILTGNIPEPEKIATPSEGLNRSLGGGILMGRIHTFWGEKASGKTTTVMHVVAEAQRMGKTVLWVDAEKTYDSAWAAACGVDVDKLLLLRVNSVEGILGEIVEPIRKEEIDLVVIDSLSSVFFESYLSDPDSNPIGGFARASNYLVGKLLDSMGLSTTVILIAHQATVAKGQHFGLAAKLSNSVEHWTSSIIKLKKSTNRDDIREDSSFKVLWYVQKSKQSMYPDEGHYYFLACKMDGEIMLAYDTYEELVHIAIDLNVMEKSGAWYEWNGVKLQGSNNWAQKLRDEPELYTQLLKEVNGLQ